MPGLNRTAFDEAGHDPLACQLAKVARLKDRAAAGHPHCVFATTVTELARLTSGAVTDAITTEP